MTPSILPPKRERLPNAFPPKEPVKLERSSAISPLSKPGAHQVDISYPWGTFPAIPPIVPGRHGRYVVSVTPKRRTPAYFLPMETMDASLEIREMRKGALRKEPVATFDHRNIQPFMPHIAVASGNIVVDGCDPCTLVYLFNVLAKADVTRVYLLLDYETCAFERAVLRDAKWPGIDKLRMHDQSRTTFVDHGFRPDQLFTATDAKIRAVWDDWEFSLTTMYGQELIFGHWLMNADKLENYNKENLSEFWGRFWQSLGVPVPFPEDKKAIAWSLAAYAFDRAARYRADQKYTESGELQKIGLKLVGAFK